MAKMNPIERLLYRYDQRMIGYEDWMHKRSLFIQNTWEMVEEEDEDDKFDYDNPDEFGNPMPVVHCVPKFIRVRYKVYLLLYYYPILDQLDKLPSCTSICLRMLRTVPTMGFIASLGFLGYSVWHNMQYEEGDCYVESMPDDFRSTGGFIHRVKGTYHVERFFEPTVQQAEGSMFLECEAVVDCEKEDHRSTERCVSFKTWAWGSHIECYYHKDDYYGNNGMRLYCLGRPSDLATEIFTVCIAGAIVVLVCVVDGIFIYRRRDFERQQRLASQEAEAAAMEIDAAKHEIEEREAAEATRVRERQEAGVNPVGLEEDDNTIHSGSEAQQHEAMEKTQSAFDDDEGGDNDDDD